MQYDGAHLKKVNMNSVPVLSACCGLVGIIPAYWSHLGKVYVKIARKQTCDTVYIICILLSSFAFKQKKLLI